MLRRWIPTLPLLGILLLALALRVWGLGWGLPSATHYFSYHPDESIVLGAAMRLNVFQGRMLPHFYNYGSLQLYLVYFANTLAFLFGSNALLITNFATQHTAWAHQYLVGALADGGDGRRHRRRHLHPGLPPLGRRAGLLAALILAVMPLHAQHSHWLTVDVPATFWGLLSLLWSARLATGDPKPLRAALLAGCFAGLAAATKYNLALMVLPLLAASAGATRRVALPAPTPPLLGAGGRSSLAPPLLGAGGVLLAFLLACPGTLLESSTFVHDFRAEAYHVQHQPGAEFTDTGSGFVYHITRNLDAGLGLPLLLLSLVAVGYALYRRERRDCLLAAFALPYYILIGLAVVRYARYVIPLLPILALWTGRLLADLTRLPHSLLRWGGVAVGAIVLLFTLGDTLLLLHPMDEPDNRDVALADINRQGARPVGFAVQPWFYTPPVSPWFCAPLPGSWVQQTPPGVQTRIVYTRDWDVQTLEAARPPLVVLSEYDYDDALRLHDPAAIAYLQALGRGYTSQVVVLETLDPTVHANAYGLFTHTLPSDMLYPDPIITLYTRK